MNTRSHLQKTIGNFLKERNYPGLQVRAMLFDMDGVLFDSMKNHTLAWFRTIQALGIDCTREEFYLYEGCTGAATINLLFQRAWGREAAPEEIERIYAEKSRHFNELPEALPMPGTKELLQKVMDWGIRPVLVTGSGQRSLLERLERVYPGVFGPEYMVTAFDVEKGKPHPEPYLKGLEKAGVKPWEAIVVENAPMGVKSGVAAGIFTIAVNTGPIPEKDLWNAGANLLYPSVQALTDRFDRVMESLKPGI